MKKKLKTLLPAIVWKILQWLKKELLALRYKTMGKPFVPGETTKAHSRRVREGFFEK